MEQLNENFDGQSKLCQTSIYLLGLAEVKAHTFEQQIIMLLNSKHNFNELKKSLKAKNYIIDHLESVFMQAKLSRTFAIIKKLSQSISSVCNNLIQTLEKQSLTFVETFNQNTNKAQQSKQSKQSKQLELQESQKIIKKVKRSKMGGIHIYNENYNRKLQKQTLIKNQLDKSNKKYAEKEQINQQNFKKKLFQKMKAQLTQLQQQIHFPIPDEVSTFIAFQRKFLQTFNHCSYAEDIQNMANYLDNSNSNAIQFLKKTEDMGEQISKFKVEIQALINDAKNKNKIRNQNLQQKFEHILQKFMGNRLALLQKTTQKLNQYKKMLKQKQENRVSIGTQTHTKQLTQIKIYQKKIADLQSRLNYREQQAQKSYCALLLKADNQILALQSQLGKSKIYQKTLVQESNQLKEQLKKLIEQLCAKPDKQQWSENYKIIKGKSSKKIILNKTKKNIQNSSQLETSEIKRRSVKKSIRLSSFEKNSPVLSNFNQSEQNRQSITQQFQQATTRRDKQTQKQIEKQTYKQISNYYFENEPENQKKVDSKNQSAQFAQMHEIQQKIMQRKKVKIQSSFKELQNIQNILNSEDKIESNNKSDRQSKKKQRNYTQKSFKRIPSTKDLKQNERLTYNFKKNTETSENKISSISKIPQGQSNNNIKANIFNSNKQIKQNLSSAYKQDKRLIQQKSFKNQKHLEYKDKNISKNDSVFKYNKQKNKIIDKKIVVSNDSLNQMQKQNKQQVFLNFKNQQIRKSNQTKINKINKINKQQQQQQQNNQKCQTKCKTQMAMDKKIKQKQHQKHQSISKQKQVNFQQYNCRKYQQQQIESYLSYVQAYSICLTNGNYLPFQFDRNQRNYSCNSYLLPKKKNKNAFLRLMKNKAISAHQQVNEEIKMVDKSHTSTHNFSQMCHSWRYKQQVSQTSRFNRETIGTINQQKQRSLSTDQSGFQLADFILKIKGLMKKECNSSNHSQNKKQFVRKFLEDKIKARNKLNKFSFKVLQQKYDPVVLQIRTRSIEKEKVKKIHKKREDIKQVFGRTKKVGKQEQREETVLPSIQAKTIL